ncbi:hypothetical protein [Desulfobacter postgatei]|uniref:hypothetical protein n=1 Tax=Desulfobacter postgatei TaxID=2293 RepID=UPI00259BBBF0|nr:hypothetical protein [uncultured Desulfobacter sp.]
MSDTKEFIKDLYKKYPKPLYLSSLGGLLKKAGHQYNNLKALVETIDGYTIAYGPEEERTAIATVEDLKEIEDLLNERAKKINKAALKFLSKMPRTLLYAFASKSKTESSVYYSQFPPFRFEISKKGENMIEIQNDLLIDAKIPLNLNRLEESVAETLHQNIKKWIEINDVDISLFSTDKHESDQITLLEELFNAIPANKRSKVVLPLDIIGYLIDKR